MALWTPRIFSVVVATSTWLRSTSLVGLVGRSSHISFLTSRRNCRGVVSYRNCSSFSLGGRWKKWRSSRETVTFALEKEQSPPHVKNIPRLYRNSTYGRGRFLQPPRKFNPDPFEYLQGISWDLLALGVCMRDFCLMFLLPIVFLSHLPNMLLFFLVLKELDLRIENLSNTGYGIARCDNFSSDAKSWVVMVPFTIPGERVTARVYRNHNNFSEASLVNVLEPSQERVEPRCKLYGLCGGCQYQVSSAMHLNRIICCALLLSHSQSGLPSAHVY